MSGGSHEWNIIINMPQDEINHECIEKLEFLVHIKTFVSLLTLQFDRLPF
jgi:hypothetical protein